MNRNKLLLKPAALACVITLLIAAACGEDHDEAGGDNHGESPAECQAIIDVCHPKDPGVPGNPVTECHSVGHDGVQEDCINAGDIVPNCPQLCIDAPPLDAEGGAALAAPTSLTATFDADASAVQMTWVAGPGNPDMYMVMRVEDASSTTETWQVPATETSYEDATAESGSTYRYMVHAMRGEEVSEPSDMVTVTVP